MRKVAVKCGMPESKVSFLFGGKETRKRPSPSHLTISAFHRLNAYYLQRIPSLASSDSAARASTCRLLDSGDAIEGDHAGELLRRTFPPSR